MARPRKEAVGFSVLRPASCVLRLESHTFRHGPSIELDENRHRVHFRLRRRKRNQFVTISKTQDAGRRTQDAGRRDLHDDASIRSCSVRNNLLAFRRANPDGFVGGQMDHFEVDLVEFDLG